MGSLHHWTIGKSWGGGERQLGDWAGSMQKEAWLPKKAGWNGVPQPAETTPLQVGSSQTPGWSQRSQRLGPEEAVFSS